jgi:hypothetical protein
VTVATALVAGNDASPQLAEAAVAEALKRAGLTHAQGVLLYLTPHFSRHAAATVQAAGRTANCLQVAGGIVAGVANETNWVFDRPAVAAMVFGAPLRLIPAGDGQGPHLALAGASTLPPAWARLPPRIGVLFNDALSTHPTAAWWQARLAVPPVVEVSVGNAEAHIGVSTGVRVLESDWTIGEATAHVVRTIGGRSAADSLRRALPAEYRTGLPLPLHLLAALPAGEGRGPRHPPRLIPIAAMNPDGSLTLGEPLKPGTLYTWAIRQPVAAEADMRATVAALRRQNAQPPDFAVFASCIGRGPYFYGGEDRDWQAIRDGLPGTPFIGAYGSGQIAPYGHANHLLQNAVALAIFHTAG